MSGSGISWAICKSASRSRQITTPGPHHCFFAGRMPFLPPNQQRQSTEGTIKRYHSDKHFSGVFLPTRWRQKSTGIDMEQNYVTVTLCICCLPRIPCSRESSHNIYGELAMNWWTTLLNALKDSQTLMKHKQTRLSLTTEEMFNTAWRATLAVLA